jgi:hypothetical protein
LPTLLLLLHQAGKKTPHSLAHLVDRHRWSTQYLEVQEIYPPMKGRGLKTKDTKRISLSLLKHTLANRQMDNELKTQFFKKVYFMFAINFFFLW